MKKGIDISTFQGKLSEQDWRNIKNSGIDFAIIRIGYTGYGTAKSKQKDDQFENNYVQCKKIGMPVGVYWYSCAVTEEEAIEEAKLTLKYLEGKQLEYPVYIDTEDNHNTKKYSKESQYSIGKNRLTKVINAYCKYIEERKYYVGIYASLSWFNNQLILDDLKAYDKWVAQWADRSSYKGNYGMWQYTSNGNVIGKRMDLNEAYYDFEKIIKEKGLNGYTKEDNNQNDNNGKADDNNKPNKDEVETKFKVGDKVKIIGTGNANSYGTGRTATGIGWTREILKIYKDREYPYQVGNNKGTTGFYKETSLKKI